MQLSQLPSEKQHALINTAVIVETALAQGKAVLNRFYNKNQAVVHLQDTAVLNPRCQRNIKVLVLNTSHIHI